MTGIVAKWYPSGYGWLSCADGSEDVHVAARHVRRGWAGSRDLRIGEQVEFDVVVPAPGRKHREARNVVRLAAGVPT